jgi:hypothetical protein
MTTPSEDASSWVTCRGLEILERDYQGPRRVLSRDTKMSYIELTGGKMLPARIY